MNRWMTMNEALGWSGFTASWLFILGLALSSLR
jgi:hypothetical protein